MHKQQHKRPRQNLSWHAPMGMGCQRGGACNAADVVSDSAEEVDVRHMGWGVKGKGTKKVRR